MSSSAIHTNSSSAKGSINFCSHSFPKPRNDHELILLMTAEIKKLHTEMKGLKMELKEAKVENAVSKGELLGLLERVMACERNSPHQPVATCNNAISITVDSGVKEVVATPAKTPAKAATPTTVTVHDAPSTGPSTEAVAEKKRDERERLAFIEGCERKERKDGQSFFISVDEIAKLKRVFLADQAKGKA